MCKSNALVEKIVDDSNSGDSRLSLNELFDRAESVVGKKFKDFNADEISAVFKSLGFSPLGILP